MRRLLMAALLCSAAMPLNLSYAAPRPACLNDAKKLCPSVIHDDDARKRCMKEHYAEFSEGCKAALAAERKASGKSDLETCRKLANDKVAIQNGRNLNVAVGAAVARCMKGGPGAI